VSFPVAVVISDLTVSNMMRQNREFRIQNPERKRLLTRISRIEIGRAVLLRRQPRQHISKLVAADVSPLQSQAKFE
jgi:hypothetical protein